MTGLSDPCPEIHCDQSSSEYYMDTSIMILLNRRHVQAHNSCVEKWQYRKQVGSAIPCESSLFKLSRHAAHNLFGLWASVPMGGSLGFAGKAVKQKVSCRNNKSVEPY